MRGQQVHGLFGDSEVVHSLRHVGDDVGLRKHNALALTGGTGCENDGGKTVGIDLVIVVGIIACGDLLAAA